MRILIIEDDGLFSEILTTFLSSKNCQSVTVDSLSAAREHLSTSHFDFVLLDNFLPDGDGIDFIEPLKTLTEGIMPIMMITGDENQVLMAEAFRKGVDDFLVKPISLDLLWLKVMRVRSLYVKESALKAQTAKLENLFDQRQNEEELARYVYEHVAATSSTDVKFVDTYIQSSSTFNGDVFISEAAPNGNRFIILADATGHGLAAAISILPLVATIKAMISKGLSLAHIVHEANNKLCKGLPDDKFVALSGVEVNPHLRQITVFNGGMPDILAIQHDGTVDHLKSTSMALGILEQDDFDPSIAQFDSEQYRNIVLISDGLIEQCNDNGEEYGMSRLLESIQKRIDKGKLLSGIIFDFSEFNGDLELTDDLSACDVQLDRLIESDAKENINQPAVKSGKLSASFKMSGGVLSSADIVGCFDNLMRCTDVAGDLRQRAFTVFAELISNGLDHGILDLDSELKNDYTGFADYMQQKEAQIEQLDENDSLHMQFDYDRQLNQIKFSIKDSGAGYDMESVSQMQDQSLSGRGIALIKKLCSEVDVLPPGNQTSVTINREF